VKVIPDKLTIVVFMRNFGVFLLGLAALITSVVVLGLVRQNGELKKSQECRFDISAEVNAINDRIGATFAKIFVVAILQPNPNPGTPRPEVVALGEQLDSLLHQLEPAIERRAESYNTCS